MGYRWKATMYYSDEETKDFLAEKSLKPNGKKISDSQYLYSLVCKDRASRIGDDNLPKRTPGIRLHPTFGIFSNFRVKENIVLSPRKHDNEINIEHSLSITKIIENRVKRYLHEQGCIKYKTRKTIEGKSLTLENKSCFYVVIINSVCFHFKDSTNISGGIQIEGFIDALISVIHVDKNLWEGYEGKYRFDKIRYAKYEKISNSEFSPYAQFSKLRELSCKDKTGGFFIPVSDDMMGFPSVKTDDDIS